MLDDVAAQAGTEGREGEEVVLLHQPARDALVQRTPALHQVLLLFEALARVAIVALVLALVDVTGGMDGGEEGLHRLVMARLGGADEIVEGKTQQGPDL